MNRKKALKTVSSLEGRLIASKNSDVVFKNIKKPGSDLLSRLSSTIGAEGLNFRVRDGNGWDPLAMATR